MPTKIVPRANRCLHVVQSWWTLPGDNNNIYTGGTTRVRRNCPHGEELVVVVAAAAAVGVVVAVTEAVAA